MPLHVKRISNHVHSDRLLTDFPYDFLNFIKSIFWKSTQYVNKMINNQTNTLFKAIFYGF